MRKGNLGQSPSAHAVGPRLVSPTGKEGKKKKGPPRDVQVVRPLTFDDTTIIPPCSSSAPVASFRFVHKMHLFHLTARQASPVPRTQVRK